MHHFTLFLSLSSFSFYLQSKTLLTYCLSTYLCFIYLRVVRYADKYSAFCVRSFVFALSLRFVALCGLIFAFGAFLFSFSFFLNRPTPPPFHDTESVASPFLNFFIFQFSKIFLLKKCGMIYLHFVCVYVGTEYLHLVVVCV